MNSPRKPIRFVTSCFVAMSALIGPAMAKTPPAPNAVHSYVLLDRTGSMQNIWDEALGAVNTYAASFGKAEAGEAALDTKITLAVFDAQDGIQFDTLRRAVNPTTWRPITNAEASPRGMTPLYDAIGRIIALAETDAPEKAVIVIMTDGEENSSREMKKADAKAALDRAERRGWEVVFLGAEFAKFSDADAVGVARNKQMAVASGQMSETMDRLAKKGRSYGQAAKGSAPIEFDAEDRAAANEEDVKKRNDPNK